MIFGIIIKLIKILLYRGWNFPNYRKMSCILHGNIRLSGKRPARCMAKSGAPENALHAAGSNPVGRKACCMVPDHFRLCGGAIAYFQKKITIIYSYSKVISSATQAGLSCPLISKVHWVVMRIPPLISSMPIILATILISLSTSTGAVNRILLAP